jgi:hypothetical protein
LGRKRFEQTPQQLKKPMAESGLRFFEPQFYRRANNFVVTALTVEQEQVDLDEIKVARAGESKNRRPDPNL